MGRPRMYDEALRERLIEEAQKMLSEDGYHGVSLRVLTRNVGTSTNAVYTLFGSKEALMAEVAVRQLDRMLGEDYDPNTSEDPRADLLKLARHYRNHATTDPRSFSGTFETMEESQRPGSLTDRINPEVKNISTRMYEPLKQLCTRIAEEMPQLELDATDMAIALWSVIHGFVGLENSGALPVSKENYNELFDRSVNALYLGWIASDPVAKKARFDEEGKTL